jgi:hypothetical protein
MRITLDIQDNKVDAFINFIKTLDYVSINNEDAIPKWQQDETARRLELVKTGKMKTRNWSEAKKDIFEK